MSLFDRLLDRLKLPRTAARVWPWIGLILGAVILVLALSAYPIALWDWEAYDESPIVWTQRFEDGVTAELLEPATFTKTAPFVSLGGLLLGSLLVAASLVGVQRSFGRARAAKATTAGPGIPWRTITACLILILIGFGVYLANDALTAFLLGLDTIALFLVAVVVATLIGAGLGALAGKVWRIGLMGHACNAKNVMFCLGALDKVLTDMGAPINSGVAVAAAQAALQS